MMDALFRGLRAFTVMHTAHNEHSLRRSDAAAMQYLEILRCRRYVTASPFAAKFVTVSPYAGNGLLRNREPFNPYRHGSSAALVMPMRMPLTISGFRGRM